MGHLVHPSHRDPSRLSHTAASAHEKKSKCAIRGHIQKHSVTQVLSVQRSREETQNTYSRFLLHLLHYCAALCLCVTVAISIVFDHTLCSIFIPTIITITSSFKKLRCLFPLKSVAHWMIHHQGKLTGSSNSQQSKTTSTLWKIIPHVLEERSAVITHTYSTLFFFRSLSDPAVFPSLKKRLKKRK